MSANSEQYLNQIEELKGLTIAIVYVFEGEAAPGYTHYDVWKSDVISSWLLACQELNCLPLILDLRTFSQKALLNSLPHIDVVINLNNGSNNLSSLGLLTSICSFIGIPCIPCNTFQIIAGEEKRIANLIAKRCGIAVPTEVEQSAESGIYRPISLGSSCGVTQNLNNTDPYNGIYQEFVPGFDMTTPMLYNPISNTIETLPPIMYYPHNKDPKWFLGETEKEKHQGYKKRPIHIAEDVKKQYIKVCKWLGIKTYCRIDARVFCHSIDEINYYLSNPVPLNRVRFLEINPMPTVKNGINFHTSLDSLSVNDSFYESLSLYFSRITNASYTGFILSSSIIALKAKH